MWSAFANIRSTRTSAENGDSDRLMRSRKTASALQLILPTLRFLDDSFGITALASPFTKSAEDPVLGDR
jgi:hypothetical protein